MQTEIVSSPPGANAELSYVTPDRVRVFRFWLYEFEQGHSLNGSTQQSKLYQHFYAKSYAPSPVSITGRVKDQSQYDLLAQYIRDHQVLLVNAVGRDNSGTGNFASIPLMRLHISGENLYCSGWIAAFEGGAKRFNVAPQVQMDFEVVNDLHSTNADIIPSFAIRSTFTGSFLKGAVSDSDFAQNQVKSNAVVPNPDQKGASNSLGQTLRNGGQ